MAPNIIICNAGASPTDPMSGDIVVCDKDNTGVNTGYDISVCPEQQPFEIIGPQRCMLEQSIIPLVVFPLYMGYHSS